MTKPRGTTLQPEIRSPKTPCRTLNGARAAIRVTAVNHNPAVTKNRPGRQEPSIPEIGSGSRVAREDRAITRPSTTAPSAERTVPRTAIASPPIRDWGPRMRSPAMTTASPGIGPSISRSFARANASLGASAVVVQATNTNSTTKTVVRTARTIVPVVSSDE